MQVIRGHGACRAQDPGENAQIRFRGNGSKAGRCHRVVADVGHGDGLQITDLPVCRQAQGQEQESVLDVRSQKLTPQVTEFIAVRRQPIQDGLGIVGVDDSRFVWTYAVFADDIHIALVFHGGSILGGRPDAEVTFVFLRPVENEGWLRGELQLAKVLVVAHG